MKTIAVTLPVLGLVFAFAAPANALQSKAAGVSAKSAPAIVSQQETCKEDEIWDEDNNQCVKREN